MTNREYFEAIRNEVAGNPEFVEFIDAQIASLDKRAESARKRAEKKKAEGDEIRQKVQDVLSENPMTVPEIVAAIGDENITSAKVVARLKQLFESEVVIKEKVKFDTGEKMTYRLA